jgi:L-rhamnonate dehydratase
MPDARIVSVEWAPLSARRPRAAGCNARRGVHGDTVALPMLRLTADDGSQGWGLCHVQPADAAALLGTALADLFDAQRGVAESWARFECPIWDLAARQAGLPVYALVGQISGAAPEQPYRVRCYDTSLYLDDLHLDSHEAGAALIADEARAGYELGQRAFKLKVGRGARYMPLEAGIERDIAVIRAVRAAIGPGLPLMIDANNGYTLNIAKRILAETAECEIFWLEEAFHEDAELYQDLRAWLRERNLPALIADGEGAAHPALLEWARTGVVDVIQYDIWSYGMTRWLDLGRTLDGWGARSAPHHYGTCYGNYVSCHLAPAMRGFMFAEWDAASAPEIDASGYTIEEGWVSVPAAPGFGIGLDEAGFRAAVERAGFRLGGTR